MILCYDNGGTTFDRYTIVDTAARERNGMYSAIGSSEYPFSPQGFGMTVSAMVGPHLGKRVARRSLPPDVQKFISTWVRSE